MVGSDSNAVGESRSNLSRRRLLRSLAAAGGVLGITGGFSGLGSAQETALSKTKTITESGQSLQFVFTGLPPSPGDLEVDVTVHGDYGYETESATVFAEGEMIGSITSTGDDIDCNTFEGQFTVSGSKVSEGSLQITVANSADVDPLCEQNYVTVALSQSNVPPTASFQMRPVAGSLMVEFDASGSTDSDGSIVSYEWDFDDDGTFERRTTSPTFVHQFSGYDRLDGIGPVTLRVTDDAGATATVTREYEPDGLRFRLQNDQAGRLPWDTGEEED